jgi:chemotaxis protein methyltransferase CheR
MGQPSLPEPLLAQVSDCLAARIGLHFPRDRWADLERGLGRAAPGLGFDDPAACGRWLLSAELKRPQIEILASHLTIGETYFFREPKAFEALESHVLPELIRARRRSFRSLRLWSAACCTGEEAFSLAILLDRLLPDLARWQITILATDINPQFLERAATGVYNDWSFRGVEPAIRAQYFTKQGGGYAILPRIKAMVTFAYHNLLEDPFPAFESNTNAMDLVLCRNVLMYFSPDCARAVVRHLYRSVIDGGWLLPGSVEAVPPLLEPFVFTNIGGAVLYRKVETASAAGPRPPCAAAPAGGVSSTAAPAPMVFRPASTAAPDAVAAVAASPYQAAVTLHQQGRYGEAAEMLATHLAAQPDDAPAILLLARSYANQGRLTEALDWCTKAIAGDRLAAGNHYLLAMIQQELGDLAAAAASLQRALFLEPQRALAQFALANLCRLQGKALEANRHYRNALALLQGRDPDEVLPESEGLTVGRLLLEIGRHATPPGRDG